MEFTVSLSQFEGPLDLMLHLVRKNKLNLFDLDLEKLASQYCAYIRQAASLSLEISSEYLEECTVLMEYKSRRLLPRKPIETEDNYQEDPAARIARRLREYEQCKKESEQLAALYEKRNKLLERPVIELKEEWVQKYADNEPLRLYTIDLMRAMERVMKRYALMQPYETRLEVREISVQERMEQVLAIARTLPPVFSFERLSEDCISVHEVIVTFLAVLELIHSGQMDCQKGEQDEIWIRIRSAQ